MRIKLCKTKLWSETCGEMFRANILSLGFNKMLAHEISSWVSDSLGRCTIVREFIHFEQDLPAYR